MRQCRQRDAPVWRRQPAARRRRQCRAAHCRAARAAQDAAGQDRGGQCQGKRMRTIQAVKHVAGCVDVCASSGQLILAASTQLCNSVELPSCLFSLYFIVDITPEVWPFSLQIAEAQATLSAKEAEVEDLKQRMAEGLSEAQVLAASCVKQCSTACSYAVHDGGIAPSRGGPAELQSRPASALTNCPAESSGRWADLIVLPCLHCCSQAASMAKLEEALAAERAHSEEQGQLVRPPSPDPACKQLPSPAPLPFPWQLLCACTPSPHHSVHAPYDMRSICREGGPGLTAAGACCAGEAPAGDDERGRGDDPAAADAVR
jgi:hypothetical protein